MPTKKEMHFQTIFYKSGLLIAVPSSSFPLLSSLEEKRKCSKLFNCRSSSLISRSKSRWFREHWYLCFVVLCCESSTTSEKERLAVAYERQSSHTLEGIVGWGRWTQSSKTEMNRKQWYNKNWTDFLKLIHGFGW